MSQPQVKVGIMSSPAIRFVFPTAYSFGGQTVGRRSRSHPQRWKSAVGRRALRQRGVYALRCRERQF